MVIGKTGQKEKTEYFNHPNKHWLQQTTSLTVCQMHVWAWWEKPELSFQEPQKEQWSNFVHFYEDSSQAWVIAEGYPEGVSWKLVEWITLMGQEKTFRNNFW